MSVAVVYFPAKNNIEKIRNIAKALAEGIKEQGLIVDLINGRDEINKKLTGYKYIAFGTEAISFFSGKISDDAETYLKNAGNLTTKRAFAFNTSTLLGNDRCLKIIMEMMEAEGLVVKNSRTFKQPVEARRTGLKLNIT